MTRTRRTLAGLGAGVLLLSGLGVTQNAQATTARVRTGTANGYVHVEGSQLIGPAGNPMKLRGVALGTWLVWEQWLMGLPGTYPTTAGKERMLHNLATVVGQSETDAFEADYQAQFITQADIQQIAADGFNEIRVPIDYRLVEDDSAPGVYDWTWPDRIIDWASQAGIYVVLDYHALPGAQNPYFPADPYPTNSAEMWKQPALAQRAINLWKATAARYTDNPAVAGYDLLSEPDASSTVLTDAQFVQFYRDVAAAIRQVDPHHVLILEGRCFTKCVSMFTSPIDPNLMLSIHQYMSATPNPLGQISSAISAADKLGGVPIWVGEYGLDVPATIQAQLARFDAQPRIVGWSYWDWKQALRSDNQHGLNEYTAPASWIPVINYIAGKSGAPKPTLAAARQGLADELAAAASATPYTALISTLQAHLG